MTRKSVLIPAFSTPPLRSLHLCGESWPIKEGAPAQTSSLRYFANVIKAQLMIPAYENRRTKTRTARLVLVVAMLFTVSAPTTAARQSITFQAQTAAPQQEDGWVAIKTDDGILFVWNVRELHFTLTIKGKEIRPLNDPEHIFFMVDGKTLQIQVASIREFAPDVKEKKLNDKTILAAHRDWESKFLEGLLKNKLEPQSFNAKLSNGGDALLWQFNMPEGTKADAKSELYVTVVRNDYVVMLNSEATATVAEETARKFLLETMATLKISPTSIDVKKLSDSIRKGAGS